MNVPAWVWVATIAGLTALILGDLVFGGRRPHAVGVKEAAGWVAFYVALAVAFGAGLWLLAGPVAGQAFAAGYVTEYSLSVDNLFVFILIMTRFKVPVIHQHRVLLIGIALSLAMRGLCIAAGAAAIEAYDWIFYVFGALLIYTAAKLVLDNGEEETSFQDGRIVRTMQRIVPTSKQYDGARMTTRIGGRLEFTPMVVVVLVIGVANVVFALDSIPAIFGLTQEAYIVFAANAFALMGLRELYFLLGGLLDRVQYLSYGLAAILGFIGLKLILEALETSSHVTSIGGVTLPHIGIAVSLGFIVVTLAVTTTVSLVKARIDDGKPGGPVEPSGPGDDRDRTRIGS